MNIMTVSARLSRYADAMSGEEIQALLTCADLDYRMCYARAAEAIRTRAELGRAHTSRLTANVR